MSETILLAIYPFGVGIAELVAAESDTLLVFWFKKGFSTMIVDMISPPVNEKSTAKSRREWCLEVSHSSMTYGMAERGTKNS